MHKPDRRKHFAPHLSKTQNATCVIIFLLFLIHELQGQLNMNFAACYLTSEHLLLVQFNVFYHLILVK